MPDIACANSFCYPLHPPGPFSAPSSATAAGEVSRGTGSPEGVVTSDSGDAVYYDESTNNFWLFKGTAGTNTGWEQFG